ncbi:TY-Chap domain-containing protein [Nocardia australiensis]|uniref:TY-Chap domain-containing protein n=1 Tax=Nocardia australiensis TaxID=2887191 RepID=UPI001D13FCAD|nr:hypothetical protein [Nocardia australiensis]
MDELGKRVLNAVERTMGRDGTGVITVESVGYVQWMTGDEGIRVEVVDPGRQRSRSLWQRLRGRADIPAEPAYSDEQIATLTRLGFTRGTQSYELEMGASDLVRDRLVRTIVSALRDVLEIDDPSVIAVETW